MQRVTIPAHGRQTGPRAVAAPIMPLDRLGAHAVTNQVLDLLTAARELLAEAYHAAPSHTAQENQIGEQLTTVRKAIEKSIKASNELGQMTFGDVGTDDDDDTRNL